MWGLFCFSSVQQSIKHVPSLLVSSLSSLLPLRFLFSGVWFITPCMSLHWDVVKTFFLPSALLLSSQSFHPSQPDAMHPPFPLIHTLTFFLSKGSTVYIINMISSERSSPSIPHVSTLFPLSLSFPLILPWPPPLFLSLLHSIWLIPLGLFLSLPRSLCFSPPPGPLHVISALLMNVMIERRQKQQESEQGRRWELDTERRIYSIFLYLSFFPYFHPPLFFSKGLHHTWASLLALWLDSLCHHVSVLAAVRMSAELVCDLKCMHVCGSGDELDGWASAETLFTY